MPASVRTSSVADSIVVPDNLRNRVTVRGEWPVPEAFIRQH
jgi:hypothetical protein